MTSRKMGLVKLRQSCWSNFDILVRSDQLTNLSFRNVSVTEILQIKIKIQGAQIFEMVFWFKIEHTSVI